MRELLGDLACSARVFRRQPAFAAAAALTLALGVGATTALFSVVEAVLLRPLPYQDEHRIVLVWETEPGGVYPIKAGTPANFLDWQARNRSLSHLAGLAPLTSTVTGAGDPFRVDGRRVTSSLFDTLGVRPVIGRTFTAADDLAGGVVIISHRLWRTRFGADPAAIGRRLDIDGRPSTLVGVMPEDFRLPRRNDDLLVPLVFTPYERQARGSHWLTGVGRLRAGVSLAQAQADMDRIARELAREYPRFNAREGLFLQPIREDVAGTLRRPLLLLLAAAGVLLAIACLNVVSLIVARAGGRREELAIRVSLGAAPARLVRQMLAEGIALSAVAAAAGLVVALGAIAALHRLLPDALAQMREVRMNGSVFLFAMTTTAVAGIVTSLVPAARLSRRGTADLLRRAGRATSDRRSVVARRVLVVTEVALAAVLLVGAALLSRSLLRVMSVEPGFETDGVLTFRLDLPASRYEGPRQWSPFLATLIDRLRALPGVQAAGAISWLPLTTDGNSNAVFVEGRPLPKPGEATFVLYRLVTAGYFEAMRIRVIAGRGVTAADSAGSPRIVVINETMARRLWPGEDPIGRRVTFARNPAPGDWMTVAGVVADTRQGSLTAPIEIEMFAPDTQERAWFPPSDFAVRVEGHPLAIAAAARAAVREIDASLAVSDIRPLRQIMYESGAEPRFQAMLVGGFSAMALVLAGVGLYGLLAYLVVLRRRELAIRAALGAQRAQVLRLILTEGLTLAGAGLVAGTAAAGLLTPALSSLLFGVSAGDAVSFVGAASAGMLAAVAASLAPAWRASRIDPAAALRD